MMANLPPIVTNSEAISGDLGSIDHVVVEDIYHLWRVYTTNKSVLPNDIGHRLENLFWRIWGSDRCMLISGATLARIFQDISEAKSIKELPAAVLPSSDPARPQSRHKDNSPVSLDRNAALSQSSLASPADVAKAPPSPPRTQPAPLTSILRKTRRVDPPSADDDYDVAPDEVGRARAAPPVRQHHPPTPTSPIRKSSAESAGGRRKKATFVVNTVSSSRRRPTITRRKSTQSYTMGSAAPLVKSPATLPTEPEDGAEAPAPLTLAHAAKDVKGKGRAAAVENGMEAVGAKPVQLSTEDLAVQRNTLINSGSRHLGESSQSVLKTRNNGQEDLSNLLVDRDFRSKFYDKRRKGELFSLTNLAMAPTTTSSSIHQLYSKSSEAPSTSRGFRKGKATQTVIVDGVAPLRPEGATAPSTRASSPSDSQLPRSRSQLTLLLERERRHGAGGGNNMNTSNKPDNKQKSRMI